MATMDLFFNIHHTKGDTFDYTIPITDNNNQPINWTAEGYISGTSKVKANPNQEVEDFTLNVDISVNGALRLYTAGILDKPAREYFYSIKFLKTGGLVETWFSEKPQKFIIYPSI